MRLLRSRVRGQTALVVGGVLGVTLASACSLFVSTSGLDSQTDTMTTDGSFVDRAVVLDAGGGNDTSLDVVVPDVGADTSKPGCATNLPGPKLVSIGYGGCMDATEVTRSQYSTFLASNPDPNAQTSVCSWNTTFVPSTWDPSKTDDPVVYVDWCDSYAYCKWAGKRLCGKIGGGSLDKNSATNAAVSQWYHGCSQYGSWAYSYGNNYDPTACNIAADGGKIAAVGSYPKCTGSYSGLFDVTGNVQEWQDSCWGDGGAPSSDICREQSGSYAYQVNDPKGSSRCDFLDSDPRNATVASVGIRCCDL